MNGIVYLLTEWSGTENRYKIGVTKNNVEKRLKQLKTGNSNELNIIYTFESVYYKRIEKMFHKKYFGSKITGEWFSLSDEEVFGFLDQCSSFHDNIKFLAEHNHFFKK